MWSGQCDVGQADQGQSGGNKVEQRGVKCMTVDQHRGLRVSSGESALMHGDAEQGERVA